MCVFILRIASSRCQIANLDLSGPKGIGRIEQNCKAIGVGQQIAHQADSLGVTLNTKKIAARPRARSARPARRGERPCCRRTAEKRDEIAPPPHHSITSSASASNVGGSVRPSSLAVGRLMT